VGEKIIAVVGARLNSSRLPKKHFLPLAGKPLIERLWERLTKVRCISKIILATTDDDYNIPLQDWAREHGHGFLAYDGDINDLMGRVDTVVKQYDADIVLYVCGDCPLIEPATIDRMFEQILSDPKIETVALKAAEGRPKNIHEGFDVYRRGFWDRMMAVAEAPFEREHVGAVYHHLKKVTPTTVAYVTEPAIYSSVEHRISVDTPSDYRFMKRLYSDWYSENTSETLVDLSSVITKLHNEPALSLINKHVYQKNIFDKSIKVALITEAGPQVGLGHLMRMLVTAAALQDYLGAKVTLFIKGQVIEDPELALIPHEWLVEFDEGVLQQVAVDNHVCVFDVKDVSLLSSPIKAMQQTKALLVGVDIAVQNASLFDVVWMPTFYDTWSKLGLSNLHGGWDCYLLRDSANWHPHHDRAHKRILILTGGSDAGGLGEKLPDMLLKNLPDGTYIDWVQGPYAPAPLIPTVNDGCFNVIVAPDNLPNIYAEYDAILCVYGVSFFECLRAGVPTVVFDAIGAAGTAEWQALVQQFPNTTADCIDTAISMLGNMLRQEGVSESMVDVSRKLRKGPKQFAMTVMQCLEEA